MGERDDLRPLSVRVALLNDAGQRVTQYGSGATTDQAVAAVEAAVQRKTGDDSRTMTDWSAA